MFAINHAATALIFKRRLRTCWLRRYSPLGAGNGVCLGRVNYLGVEHTTTEPIVRYVGDIHLTYMPLSHSVVTVLGAVCVVWSMGAVVSKAHLDEEWWASRCCRIFS